MVRHHVRSFGTHKIMAIKLVRELTHCGLKDAKDLVESASGFFVRAGAVVQAQVAEEARRYGIEFDPPLDGTVAVLDEPIESGAGACSVRFVSGARLIPAIKLVRELTGLGLAEAKRVVDHRTLIRTGLSRAEAEKVVQRFAEIDAQVDIVDDAGLPPARRDADSHDADDQDDDDF